MTQIFRAALALASALVLLACASRPEPPRLAGGEDGERPAGFSGGLIASPIGLAMTDFDADKDRATTRAELEAGVDSVWSFVDVDGNGEASAVEFADWSRAAMGSDTAIPGRVAFDRDASGVVSRAEFAAGLNLEFTRLDADSDGVIERAELIRLVEPGGMGMGGPRGGTIMRRGPGGPGGGGPGGAGEAPTGVPTEVGVTLR